MATKKNALTDAQARVLQAVSLAGRSPRNTTVTMLRKLEGWGLIQFDGLPPNFRGGNWKLTEAGTEALRQYKAAEACRNLAARCNGLLF